jgi:ABC-type multidrug transport system permease subunit
MEDNAKLIESLIEKATDYGKTTFELVKLRAIDKTSDVVSSFIPSSIVFVLIMSFVLFFNLGFAFWLGEILGKTYYGFFIVAGFYGILAIVLRLLMYKWLKKLVGNYIIKKVLK